MKKRKPRSTTLLRTLRVLLIISLVFFLIVVIRQETQEPDTRKETVSFFPSSRDAAVTFSPPMHFSTPIVNAVTFSSSVIPSTIEIGNPERGAQYYGHEEPPPHFPLVEYSDRWCWSGIEPSQGQYNFQLIDDLAAKAKAKGGSFGWRIMPINDFASNPCLPTYLSDVIGGGVDADLNHSFYLERVQAMLDALAQRYANDPRIDLLDMSYVGCYGEWNTSCGGTDMTAENRQKIINMQYRAFPSKQFFMLTDREDSLHYALEIKRAKPTGVRIDCLGTQSLGGARTKLENDPKVRDRWKIAPLYFEYCDGPDFALSLMDIKRYHASLIGDGEGNIESFKSYDAATQELMLKNYRASGYRFELMRLALPKRLAPGQTFQVASQWKNVNYAPAYTKWNVMIQLRNASQQVVWQEKSTLDLRIPFSDASQGNDVKLVNDKFTLPTTLASGQYRVAVRIIHADAYHPPLALAIEGRQADGSYILGEITV